MWLDLLLDLLLSLFGQSGGRYFKLLSDEVIVLITWLWSSFAVCLHVHMHTCVFLTWILFPPPPLRTSAWEQNVSVLQQRLRAAQGLPPSPLCTVLLSQADVPSFRRYFGAIAGDMSPAVSSAAVTINLASVSEGFFFFRTAASQEFDVFKGAWGWG